jgi:acyl transferase domain-containing protein
MAEPCAIVGMACIFPGAPDIESFWSNLCNGVDSITDLPDGRWDSAFYDPAATSADRLQCRRGGFIDDHALFNPTAYGVMPNAARKAEPDQLLALQVADRALRDLGSPLSASVRRRTGVVLGRGGYTGPARIRFEQHVRVAEQLVSALRDLVPDVTEPALEAVRRRFQQQVDAPLAEDVIGLVPNLVASRITERLDLGGPAYTVDAACASTLFAVDAACRELRSGQADLMLAGGVHLCHAETFWAVFAQLGALSKQQVIRPFDERADGLLIGEGIGVLVLKRLSDALADGDRVYAALHSVGMSSDGRAGTAMSPAAEGQLLALSRAWEQSGLDPQELGLLEAHGTATKVGDATEVEALARFFGGPRADEAPVSLGSVKSNIGHAMPAAGAAGLIKAALSVFHGVRPKTLNAERPTRSLDATRFRLQQHTESWSGERRVAATSAFGFGGANAHAVLASAPRSASNTRAPGRSRTDSDSVSLLWLSANSRDDLARSLHSGATPAEGPFRFAMVDPTPARIVRAGKLIEQGQQAPRDGIFYSERPLLQEGGRLVFLFPGLDANVGAPVDDVAAWLGQASPKQSSGSIEEIGRTITHVNQLCHAALERLGIRPDFIAGHSIGEWNAMVAAGVISATDLERIGADLLPGSLPVATDVVFAAAATGLEDVQRVVAQTEGIEISHDNCPHQVVFCGLPDKVELVADGLRRAGVVVQRLPFGTGIHTTFFGKHVEAHARHLAALRYEAPKVPLYSATHCDRYPESHDQILALTVEHMVTRVRFRELVERLYADGGRVFVQVGMGSLASFVEDTLRGREHLVVSMLAPRRSGLAQLRQVASALFAAGAAPSADEIGRMGRRLETVDAQTQRLRLGVPLVRLDGMLGSLQAGAAPLATNATPGASAIERAFAESMRSATEGQSRVLAALRSARAATTPPDRTSTFVTTASLQAFPELVDHSFFRQREGWSNRSDSAPVVPLTGLLELMRRAAEKVAVGRSIVGFEQVWAKRWLLVSEPAHVETRCTWVGVDRVSVELVGYAQATVALRGDELTPSLPSALVLEREREPSIDARRLYAEHWMFHGPAYQGVVRLGPIGDDGIRGRLRGSDALGSLLDCAGQLLGYWMLAQSKPTMAMPVRIERLSYEAPTPAPGEEVECTVRIRRTDNESVIADMEIIDASGRPWVRIEGWEDRCIPVDEALWGVVAWPENNLLSETLAPGLCVMVQHYKSALAQQYLEGRYLMEVERDGLTRALPEQRRARLMRMVMAKDAVRSLEWSRAQRPMFPAELSCKDDATSCVEGASGTTTRIYFAESGELRACLACAHGGALAIVPIVADSIALSPDELGLIEHETDAAAWRARVSAARVAMATSEVSGRMLHVRDRRGDRFLVGTQWVNTLCHKDHALAWMTT